MHKEAQLSNKVVVLIGDLKVMLPSVGTARCERYVGIVHRLRRIASVMPRNNPDLPPAIEPITRAALRSALLEIRLARWRHRKIHNVFKGIIKTPRNILRKYIRMLRDAEYWN